VKVPVAENYTGGLEKMKEKVKELGNEGCFAAISVIHDNSRLREELQRVTWREKIKTC